MQQNILYVGLDVDDTLYHGAAFNKDTGEILNFKCRPTLKGLLQQLDRLARHFPGRTIKLCYEASYVGYCLQRDLMSHDIHIAIGPHAGRKALTLYSVPPEPESTEIPAPAWINYRQLPSIIE